MEIHPNLRKLLQYFHQLSIEGETGRFDSRRVHNFVKPGFTKEHVDWITFIKDTKSFLARYGEVDLRVSPEQKDFAMLTADQASILLCFDASESSVKVSELLKQVNHYRALDRPGKYEFGAFIMWFLDGSKDKTLEETNKKHETPLKKEKRLEREFGENLASQGIPVQYQVPCEYGIADIVTPDAIYEIKASLARSTLHKAISQVLLYRNCLNPSAKAIVVGYPYRQQPVDIHLANSLGVEVIVCEDQGPEHEAEKPITLKKEQKRRERIIPAKKERSIRKEKSTVRNNTSVVPSRSQPDSSPFDAIRQIRDNGSEFWSARDLQELLQYRDWRNFEKTIERAMISCKVAGREVSEHFVESTKVLTVGNGAQMTVKDYHLTRFACYSIAMNGDVDKPSIATAQTYFMVQTRKTELAEEAQRLAQQPTHPQLPPPLFENVIGDAPRCPTPTRAQVEAAIIRTVHAIQPHRKHGVTLHDMMAWSEEIQAYRAYHSLSEEGRGLLDVAEALVKRAVLTRIEIERAYYYSSPKTAGYLH
jgi:hypothetical protein